MDPQYRFALADAVLLLHLGIILFNVRPDRDPLGRLARLGFVRVFWWRALHLAILAAVALQAVLQRVCFLTVWQFDLLQPAGGLAAPTPLMRPGRPADLLAAAALGL